MAYNRNRENGMTDDDAWIVTQMVYASNRLPDGLSAKVAESIDSRIRAERLIDAAREGIQRAIGELGDKRYEILIATLQKIRSRTVTAPDWNEHRDVTLKLDGFTFGAICLALAVMLYVATRRTSRADEGR